MFDDKRALILLGHNGAGKSTLIRYLLGFYPDRSAHPFLKDWAHITPVTTEKVSFVPEFPYLDGNLTGWDMFKLMGTLKNTKITVENAKTFLEKVGLKDLSLKKQIGIYSKGMKQRLMIAFTLMTPQDVLIMDEPLSGLDPFGHAEIIALLKEIRKDCKLVVSTHNLQDAFELADDIWLLKNGEFAYSGEKPMSESALKELFFNHDPNC